ncbi:MAG TPA: FAD-binding protein, partial [Burkholderiales bacterium]|nr:FAD-binding protein [Burkholderiales bacterium]
MQPFDVLVVGKGNAALCAALSARDAGARVAMLEAAPEDESGGNSRFAGGVMRFSYDSVKDLQRIADIPGDEVKSVDWESNTQ